MNEVCPHCQEPRRPGTPRAYQCGSEQLDTRFVRSPECRIAELEAENSALRAEIASEQSYSLAEIIKSHVTRTLSACDGNKKLAARKLGVSLKTIYNLTNKWEDDNRVEQDTARRLSSLR